MVGVVHKWKIVDSFTRQEGVTQRRIFLSMTLCRVFFICRLCKYDYIWSFNKKSSDLAANLLKRIQHRINDLIIRRKVLEKFLGVIIHESINQACHISIIKIEMARYLGVMYKIIHTMHNEQNTHAYFSQFRAISLKLFLYSVVCSKNLISILLSEN